MPTAATISPIQPAPRGAQWIDLGTAALRSGLSARHLRRRCFERWHADGLARLEQRPGSKPAWFLRDDADPSLARVARHDADSAATALRDFSQDKRKIAMDRLRILTAFNSALKSGFDGGKTKEQITEEFLAQLLRDEGAKLSRRTLHDWDNRYRDDGLAGLIDHRGIAAPEDNQGDPFLEELTRQYLTLRRRSKMLCYEIASTLGCEREWIIPTYRTACRHLAALPKATVLKLRHGDEAYTNEAEPYIERDYSTLQSNEQWVGDHHQFDVMVEHEGQILRPWLTAWMDMRSRLLVGWTITAAGGNTDTILNALRAGVKEYGVPAEVLIDNGKDYDSAALQGETKKQRRNRLRLGLDINPERIAGVFGQLGVKVRHCPPYHPQSKTIERFFRTVCDRFSVLFETYTGSNPQQKPEDLPDQLASGKAIPLAEFVELFTTWLADDYHLRGHGGDSMDGRAPLDVWQACLTQKRTAPEDLLDLVCQQRIGPVSVTQNGVTYQGLRYGRGLPELLKILGDSVVLRVDERDLSHVTIWTTADRFICRAPVNQKLPANADKQQLRDAIREKKRMRRLQSDFHAARPRLHEDVTEVMRRRAAQNRQNNTDVAHPQPNDLPSLKPIRTPLNDQMPALQRAFNQLRTAVGAETLTTQQVSAALSNFEDDSSGPDDFLRLAQSIVQEEES